MSKENIPDWSDRFANLRLTFRSAFVAFLDFLFIGLSQCEHKLDVEAAGLMLDPISYGTDKTIQSSKGEKWNNCEYLKEKFNRNVLYAKLNEIMKLIYFKGFFICVIGMKYSKKQKNTSA